jgi:hypothetical protein
VSTVVYDALAEFRREIEEAAADHFVDHDTRLARLREFRLDVVDLLGVLDTYIGDETAARGEEPPGYDKVVKLRENAEIREQMIERGMASAEELDEIYMYSHETLDELAEEGLLEEAAGRVSAIFNAARFNERLHPRGRGGKWIDKPGGGASYLQQMRQRPRPQARPKPPKAKPRARAPERPERDLPDEEKGRLYQQRKKELEKRAGESVAKAAAEGRLTDAEAHFNDAGKVSQRTLAMYVDQAKTKPTTADQHSSVNANGDRVWDQSRRELHERIITAFLKKRVIDPETGKPTLDFSPEAEDLQSHPDGPQVMFSGGGYAAGKGSVLKILGARDELPPDSFTLDPDQIKAELPEFQEMIGSDPEANMHVYQEAWAISQEIQARAMERKLNIVVDGISDTSPDEMGERARAFTARGYKAKAVYVDIPTDEAMKRAANRAINAKEDSDRRMIPEIIMRSVHRDVASTVPALFGYLDEHDIPLDVEVWDNNAGKDSVTGQFLPPRQVLTFVDGKKEIIDQELWDAFVAKGYESILHVDVEPASSRKRQKSGFELAAEDTAERRAEFESKTSSREAQLAYTPTLIELQAAEASGDKKRIAAARKAEEKARERLQAALLAETQG